MWAKAERDLTRGDAVRLIHSEQREILAAMDGLQNPYEAARNYHLNCVTCDMILYSSV